MDTFSTDTAPPTASHRAEPDVGTPTSFLPEVRRTDIAPAEQDRRSVLPPRPEPVLPTRRRRWIVVALAAAIAVVSGAWYWFETTTAAPDGLIQANGRIESDIVNVSSKLAGRIVALAAREGDVVEAGSTLVQLDDRTMSAQLQEAQSTLAAADARLQAARVNLAVMRKEVPVALSIADANLNAARAVESRALALESQNQRDAQRAQRLFGDGSLPQQAAEQAELAWQASRDQRLAVQADRARLEEARKDAALGPDRIRAREADLLSLDATRQQAAARVVQAQTAVDDLRVASPIGAVVTSRFANIGEVVNAGMPLLELVDLDRLYLKVYVPEKEIGKVRRGLPARIYSDAFPQEPFDATVRYIGSRAEFTPKEVQTPDERTKLVYEVRLYLTRNPDHKLTPGLPADAVIRWKQDAPWQPPRW